MGISNQQKLKSVFNAFRPWSLSTAAFSVSLGAFWALRDGYWSWLVYLLVLIGGCLLQAASNLFNTYGDFVKGVDTVETAVRSPELVKGYLKPKTIKYLGYACCLITAIIGIYLIYAVDWKIIIFGLIGIAFAYGYTMGVAYKYLGLGLIMVFVLMGEIMVLGSYYALASKMDWSLMLVTIPNACLITAILSGNELRDFYGDRASGIRTFSVKIGYDNSRRLYKALHIVPYVMTVALILFRVISPWMFLTLLTLPQLWSILKNADAAKAGDKKANFALVPKAFKLHWQFVGLMLVALILEIGVNKF